MPDVKEVVNGLEMSYKYSNVDENNTLVPQWIVLHAIALLKAQEPMSPVTSEVQYGDHLQHCPSCGKALPNSGEYGISHFCYKCGKAVKR